MQHQVVKRRIGKAEEQLVGSRCRLPYRIVREQIRRQTVRVVPADRTEDHVDLRIPERRKQILRPLFGMILDVFPSRQRVRQILYPDPHFREPPFADFPFVAHIVLAEGAGRETNDTDGVYVHALPLSSEMPELFENPIVYRDSIRSCRAV